MRRTNTRRSVPLLLEYLETREAPSASPWLVESFDGTATGALPAGWSQWTSSGASVAVSSAQAYTAPNSLAISSTLSSAAARAWVNAVPGADLQASADVFLSTLIPTQIIARASGLNTTTPSYYALSLTRGLQVQLLRVVNGVSTSLGQLTSTSYFSQNWVKATLSVVGTTLQAQIYRPDTGQYLNAAGQWQSAPAWALSATDSALGGTGQVGLARPASYTGTVNIDDFTVVVPNSPVESFDTTPVGSLPGGWTQWSSTGSPAFAVSSAQALSAPNGLAVTANASSLSARAWLTQAQPADVQVGAAAFLTGQIPAQVLARGTGLDTTTPTYYALSITSGLQVQLLRVVQGTTTVLGQVKSTSWLSGQWVRVALAVTGTTIQAQVFRTDTAQYLNNSGGWQAAPCWALSLGDSAIAGPGLVGVGRPASYTGTMTFDDFYALPAPGDTVAPTVTIANPAPAAALSGVVQVQANASDNVAVARVEFYLDNVLRATDTQPSYTWSFDTTTAANGTHTLTVLAYDLAGNVGQASETITVQGSPLLPQPSIPQHLPNIRIAELAFTGTPTDATMNQLLQNDVDLVVAAPQLSAQIHSVAPNTPQLLYANVSSLYGNSLTSWLAYASANGLDPEAAFYHVTQATPFSGSSPSSQPVSWFWAVYRGGASLTDLTSAAHSASSTFSFGSAGQAVCIAYPNEFREIDVTLSSGAAGGWAGVWQYASAVDANGNPTAWSTLPLLSDTTGGLATSGQVLFDPPADWKMATVNGSAPMYYVRFVTTQGGTAPVALTILGADYVNANGGTSGVILAFDSSADTDHDGYLSDAEYANRKPGMNARFLYQSRAFYANYGQMRFAVNPADPDLAKWAASYFTSLLQSDPWASGLFIDNSSGVNPVNGAAVAESLASYAAAYGNLLNAIGLAIEPDWILANVGGGSSATDPVIAKIQGFYDEFALRPLSGTYQTFETLANQVAEWESLTSPSVYGVIDSLPTGGSPTDPRTQLATLAEYYLIGDPTRTFLDFYGGYAPSTSWSQHWSPAAAYNIGQPAGTWSVFATGADPANTALTYKVYQRAYTNALVLYRPLSYGNSAIGTTADASAVTFTLNGTYRPLQADGTLGAPETSVTLRNGEGAILVKTS